MALKQFEVCYNMYYTTIVLQSGASRKLQEDCRVSCNCPGAVRLFCQQPLQIRLTVCHVCACEHMYIFVSVACVSVRQLDKVMYTQR